MKASWRIALVIALVACLLAVVVAPAVARTLNGSVTGVVIDPAGKPVKGAMIQLWDRQWWDLGNNYEWRLVTGLASFTGRSGAYRITTAPGTYRVWVIPPNRDTYCMEAYPNAALPHQGDDVIVRAGKTTSRVSVQLDGDPGVVAGRATVAATGTPLAGITIRLGIQGTGIINTEFDKTLSDADGYYRFSGLKPYIWGIWAFDERGVEPAYENLILGMWDGVYTSQPGTKTLDADMEPVGFASVVGTLTTDAGAPLGGVEIVPYQMNSWDGSWEPLSEKATLTAENGTFAIANLFGDQTYMFKAWDEDFADYGFYHGGDESGDMFTYQRGHTIDLGTWQVTPPE